MVCAWRHSLPAKMSVATIARYVNLYRIICPSMTDNCFFELSLRWLAGCVYRGDECPLRVAGSTGRCNTGVKSLRWGFKLQGLTWSFIELTRHLIQISLRVHRQVGSLGKVLSQQTIGVLVGTALPRTLRIAEVNVDVGRQRKSSMIRKFLAPVPGQRLIQLTRQHFRLLDERGNNRLGVLIGHLR